MLLISGTHYETAIVDAGGEVVGIATIARDITEHKRAAEVASRAKSEFLASISHEIRTP